MRLANKMHSNLREGEQLPIPHHFSPLERKSQLRLTDLSFRVTLEQILKCLRAEMSRNECDEICEEALHDEARAEEARQALVTPSTAERLAQVFRALADPTRVRIVSALARAELCVGDLAAVLGMSVSAVSHQLRLLRELHVVRKRREGKHIYYALDDEHVGDLFARGLEHVQHE
jgi:DNA-binding transcriptional ArsR family regulator